MQATSTSLISLRQKVRQCTACPLVQETTNGPTPGIGRKTGIVFVGRNPGANEDQVSGEPFSGPAGRILRDEFLPICRLTINDIFLTNLVLCFTMGNREPEIEHTRTCVDLHLFRYLEYLQPYLVVALGGLPAYVLTGAHSIAQIHGQVYRNRRGFYVIPCFHPGALLYDPQRRQQVHYDAMQVRRFLANKDKHLSDLRQWMEAIHA